MCVSKDGFFASSCFFGIFLFHIDFELGKSRLTQNCRIVQMETV